MKQFRLHLDVPLGLDEEKAVRLTNNFAELLRVLSEDWSPQYFPWQDIQYRLGHDEDRGKSNYLKKTEFGHNVGKKSKLFEEDENAET